MWYNINRKKVGKDIVEMLSKIIVQLLACFIGWHIGKYIAIKIMIRKAMKESNEEEL